MVGGRRSIVKADSKLTCREIPEEILVEILVRLPGVSLMRFKCVSKIWSSMISSRYFINLFFKFSSSKRERHVFVYADDDEDDCMLFSSSLSNIDATDSFLQLHHDLTLLGMKDEDDLDFVNAVRGLICFRVRAEIRIVNFTTKQILSLPLESRIKSNTSAILIHEWNYFGYDPVTDEYKVLNVISYVNQCISRVSKGSKRNFARRLRSETQILVLGAGASWRNTKSITFSLSHCPHGQGISINGVLYYGAWYDHDKRCELMSFDLNSEEFNLIKFPLGPHVDWYSLDDQGLMNFQDRVTFFNRSRLTTECILDIWVLEDAGKSKWSHKFFSLPCHELRLSLNIKDLEISGTSRSGEILLSKRFGNRRNKKNTLAVYDVDKKRIMRRFVIEPPCPEIRNLHLWDDVESITYLEA